MLRQAAADAEAAAAVDDRWRSLRAQLRAARDLHGSAAFERAVDGLVAECERVNEIVRRGGREEPAEPEAASAG